jgi:hypothetical protein
MATDPPTCGPTAAEKPKGPMPTGRRWKEVPVPFFFHEATAETFGTLEPRADDVFMASLGKGGTTWCHKILHLLLHGLDDDGQPVPEAAASIGSKGQVYPEALPLEPVSGEPEPGPEAMRRQFMGDWGYSDLLAQASPRLVSTHLFGAHLPTRLVAADGSGRLIVVLRNLKDVLSSLHFFRGEAKDGWLGNEHGPGSLARFLDPECPNAYGSVFDFVRGHDALAKRLGARVHVVYYEELQRDLRGELERLASFLGASLPPAKLDAIVAAVAFDAMKQSGDMSVVMRKGGVGDWRTHLSREHWQAFDAAFDAALDGVALAEPMRPHMAWVEPDA